MVPKKKTAFDTNELVKTNINCKKDKYNSYKNVQNMYNNSTIFGNS